MTRQKKSRDRKELEEQENARNLKLVMQFENKMAQLKNKQKKTT